MNRNTLSDWHQDLVILLEKRNAGESVTDFDPARLEQAWNEGKTPDQFLRERTQANSPKRQEPVIVPSVDDAPPETLQNDKSCPFCGESILAVAIRCKHCGSMLNATPPQSEGWSRLANVKNALIVTVLSIALIGLLGAGIIGLLIQNDKWSRNREAAQQSLTVSRLKQVDQALQVYMSDWDDVYPCGFANEGDFRASLGPYIRNYSTVKDLFYSANPSGGTLMPNPVLASVPSYSLTNLDHIWVLKEEHPWSDGSIAVLERGAFVSVPEHRAHLVTEDALNSLKEVSRRFKSLYNER